MENNSKKNLTLCIAHKDNKVLLGMKKRGFGEGRWNGFGGKVKEEETIVEAMNRELFEECGIKVSDYKELGVLDFSWKEKPEILQVHVFKASEFSGGPKETEGMKPEWFDIEKIPFNSMWSDDKFWFSFFLMIQITYLIIL